MKKPQSILNVFKGYESSLVTVVITSCGRTDLLERTINSFCKFNTFPLYDFIIIDDSGNKQAHKKIREMIPLPFIFIPNKQNIGLIASIDRAYEHVCTPFIFHCEDDWKFYRPGFIEKSLEILLLKPEICFVWIRKSNDTNGHPIEEKIYKAGSVDYRLMSTHYLGIWHGFGFNPGLRRMSDYLKVGPYNNISPNENTGMRECYVAQQYFKLGMRAAILLEGYTKHIGEGRRTYTLD